MRIYTPQIIYALLSLIIFCPRAGYAWNSTGHEIVAQIAYDQLSPKTRSILIGVLRAHPRVKQDLLHDAEKSEDDGLAMFLRAATWPDMVRYPINPMNRTEHHGPWHYINFPIDFDGVSGPQPNPKWDGHSEPANLLEALDKVTAE